MKIVKIFMLSIMVAGLIFACKAKEAEKVEAPAGEAPSYGEQAKAPSYGKTPSYGAGEGNAEKGKALFNDTDFANATSGKSCNSCHPGGRGIEKAADKTEFNLMGRKQNSLEEAVNICIEIPLKGTPVDPDSREMKDIVSYIKSL